MNGALTEKLISKKLIAPEHARIYLYQQGNECSDLTNGWVNGYSLGAYTRTKETSDFLFTIPSQAASAYSECVYCTNNTIDLTNFNKLCVDWEAYGGGGAATDTCQKHFFVSSSKAVSRAAASVVAHIAEVLNFSRKVDYIDVSNLDGLYYINIGTDDGTDSYNLYGNCKVYNMWGER